MEWRPAEKNFVSHLPGDDYLSHSNLSREENWVLSVDQGDANVVALLELQSIFNTELLTMLPDAMTERGGLCLEFFNVPALYKRGSAAVFSFRSKHNFKTAKLAHAAPGGEMGRFAVKSLA